MNEKVKVFHVVLTEDQIVDLGNLSVTLHENLDRLEDVPDFDSEDTSVAEMVKVGLPALVAVLRQLEE